MKKNYEKPQVCIETFYLSEHIANCNWIYQNHSQGACLAEGKIEGTDITVNMFAVGVDSACNLDGGVSCEYTPDGVANTMMS